MTRLRHLCRALPHRLMALVLAALAMQALVPAGLMVVPAPGHGAQITLCPQTHPLARALAAKATAEMQAMAAFHAAMGHGAMGHGAMDHAAMGHAPDDTDDPASSAASAGQSCAFAGAGALAGLLPVRGEAIVPPAAQSVLAPAPLQPLRLVATSRLRPPLRAPPALI